MSETVQVLLIEDDPGDARLLEESVDGGPFVFTRASSLAEAIDLLGDVEKEVDVIIADLGLPDSEWEATVTRLVDARPDLPIVALTGRDDDEFARAAVNAGAQDYVVKGTVAGSALVRLICHAIERQSLYQTMKLLHLGREALVNLGRLALEGAELDVLFDEAASCLHSGLHVDLAAVVEAGFDGVTTIHRAGRGAWDLDDPVIRAEPNGLAHRILTIDETLVVDDLANDPRFTPPRDLLARGMASCCLVRLSSGDEAFGFVGVASRDRRHFHADEVGFVEAVGYVVSQAIHRSTTERALAERVKEMTVLVGINRDKQRDLPREVMLTRAAERIVWGMTDPALATAIIELDEERFAAGHPLPADAEVLESAIVIHDEPRGFVRVGYREPHRMYPEESQLVRAVAEQIGFWIQRTALETELRDSRQRLQALFDNALDAFFLADDNGHYVEVNPAAAALTGYTRDELRSMSAWDLTPATNVELGRTAWRQFMAAGQMVGDYEITRKDGRVVNTEFRAVADIVPGFHLSVIRDVSERRQAESKLRSALEQETRAVEELRVLDQMKSGFLQATSHELRTPLTAILGYARTLSRADDQIGPGQRQQFLERLIVNGERLERLITDLLELGSATYAAAAMTRVETDLVVLAGMVVQRADLGGRHADRPTGSVVVPVDASRVERLIGHLVDNAVKHTPQGARIRVGVAEIPDGALVTVEDDGPGIPDDLKHAIFEPFWQGPEMTAHASPGTGVGLALVARIAESHGGRVWIEEPENGGTRVCVTLPATLAPPTDDPAEPGDEGPIAVDDARRSAETITARRAVHSTARPSGVLDEELLNRALPRLDAGDVLISFRLPDASRSAAEVHAFSVIVRGHVRAMDLVFATSEEVILILRGLSRTEARQFTRRIAAEWAEKSGRRSSPHIGIVAVDEHGGAIALDRARSVVSEQSPLRNGGAPSSGGQPVTWLKQN